MTLLMFAYLTCAFLTRSALSLAIVAMTDSAASPNPDVPVSVEICLKKTQRKLFKYLILSLRQDPTIRLSKFIKVYFRLTNGTTQARCCHRSSGPTRRFNPFPATLSYC